MLFSEAVKINKFRVGRVGGIEKFLSDGLQFIHEGGSKAICYKDGGGGESLDWFLGDKGWGVRERL